MTRKSISPVLGLVNALAESELTPKEPKNIVLNHKKRAKSNITSKQPKPGKNKPAKGYNPETKEWS